MKSPILLVDDDRDDIDLITAAAEVLQIGRPIKYFHSGNELIEYLKQMKVAPLLIISDVNLPGETGFEIKDRIAADDDLHYKSVPFIFWSTSASEKQIQKAYDLPAQGFFFKPNDFDELCETLKAMVDYWQKSQHPKQVIIK